MEVTEILVGGSKVRVETQNSGNYEYKREGSEVHVGINPNDEIVEAIEERSFSVVKEESRTIKRYIHDEASARDYREISDDLDREESDDLVRRIADVGYEVEIEIEVTSDGSAYVTHVFGIELTERKEI